MPDILYEDILWKQDEPGKNGMNTSLFDFTLESPFT